MQNKQVVIIGAGLSGLVCAYRLKALGLDCLLIEKSDHPGGVMQSERLGGFLIERGPNSAQGTPELLALIEETGIGKELIEGDPKAPAYVYYGGKLRAVPTSPQAFLTSDLLSLAGKFRLLGEPFIGKRGSPDEESVYAFIRRRLGVEIAERLVAPFVSGIYAGNEKHLSIQAAFPLLTNLEQEYGSLFRGAVKKVLGAMQSKAGSQTDGQSAKKPVRRRSVSFRDGMGVLPVALRAKIGQNLLLGCGDLRFEIAESQGKPFLVSFRHSGTVEEIACKHLVFATPAYITASLINSFTHLADASSLTITKEINYLLREIAYPPLTILYLAYDRSSITHPLNGFGFLAAPSEKLNVLGCIFSSSQFAGRAPREKVLFTIFIGGARNPELTDLPDEALVAKAHADLQKVLGISASPQCVSMTRWQRAIPQYNLGHAGRVQRLEEIMSQIAGLHLSGNYLHGVSIGDCVKEADHLAQTIFQSISR